MLTYVQEFRTVPSLGSRPASANREQSPTAFASTPPLSQSEGSGKQVGVCVCVCVCDCMFCVMKVIITARVLHAFNSAVLPAFVSPGTLKYILLFHSSDRWIPFTLDTCIMTATTICMSFWVQLSCQWISFRFLAHSIIFATWKWKRIMFMSLIAALDCGHTTHQ